MSGIAVANASGRVVGETDGLVAKIEISFMESGNVLVNAPTGNKVLCLGLLEAAKGMVMSSPVESNDGH